MEHNQKPSPITQEEAQEHVNQFNEEMNKGAPQEPELILGKFKTPEDLAQAYTELEKKLGSKPVEETAPPVETPEDFDGTFKKPEEPEPTTNDGPSLQEYLQQVAVEGRDIDSAIREDMKTRFNLDDDTITTLANSAVRLYKMDLEDILTQVGGQDGFDALNSFIVENYDQAGIDAINAGIRNKATRSITIQGLINKMNESQPAPAPDIQTTNINTDTVSGYQSREELQAAMSDPRLLDKHNPQHEEFTKEFTARMAKTPWAH